MKRILIIIILSAIHSGCDKELRNVCSANRRSYVMNFAEIKGITLRNYNYAQSEIHFSIVFSGLWYSYNDTGEKKEIYDALCEKYGDMAYNRLGSIECESSGPFSLVNSFVSVEILSDADYDETHPAGSSLADLSIFSAYSAKPFIDSGYIEYEEVGIYYKRETYPIYKKVSELTAYDLTLLTNGGSNIVGNLIFESRPILSKTHTFTVAFTDERGNTFSDSIEMTFE